jgi:hypothetical protein
MSTLQFFTGIKMKVILLPIPICPDALVRGNHWECHIYGAIRFNPMDRLSGGQKTRNTLRLTS